MKSIDFAGESLDEAFAPESVTIRLDDEIDISRGDTLVRADEKQPHVEQDVTRLRYARNTSSDRLPSKHRG